MYLPIDKRFSSASGGFHCGTRSTRESLAEKFLQRAEWAEPSAENAASNQHHRNKRVAGDDDHQRLGQVETPCRRD
jgi:hypothetical protein